MGIVVVTDDYGEYETSSLSFRLENERRLDIIECFEMSVKNGFSDICKLLTMDHFEVCSAVVVFFVKEMQLADFVRDHVDAVVIPHSPTVHHSLVSNNTVDDVMSMLEEIDEDFKGKIGSKRDFMIRTWNSISRDLEFLNKDAKKQETESEVSEENERDLEPPEKRAKTEETESEVSEKSENL